jgi:NADH dehydrogenase FAD-containing subunit
MARNPTSVFAHRRRRLVLIDYSRAPFGATPPRADDAAPPPPIVVARGVRPRPRIVILGSGWAGFTLARRLDKSIYDVRVISPANHFLFTPLLPSTAVGTLEFRAIQEPVRTIRGLDRFYHAKATKIDLVGKRVTCEDSYKKGAAFDVTYDYLCIAGGMKSNTFHVRK